MPALEEKNPSGTEYFQRLADGAPVLIWMAGHDMGCFYFNRAWLDFVGRTLEQEAGNGWAEGVHPEDLERCVNHYISCFQRRMPFAMTYRLRHHTGEFRWILDRGAPHFDAAGEFLGYYGGCAELTDTNLVTRHSALGGSLLDMREFARLKAEHQGESGPIEHAANELKRLAQDMASYGLTPRGACLSGATAG